MRDIETIEYVSKEDPDVQDMFIGGMVIGIAEGLLLGWLIWGIPW